MLWLLVNCFYLMSQKVKVGRVQLLDFYRKGCICFVWFYQLAFPRKGFFLPSSGIASCVGTARMVTWCLHLTCLCCVALGQILIWVVCQDWFRSFVNWVSSFPERGRCFSLGKTNSGSIIVPYNQLIKKAIRGGPHRVAIICMLQTHWLGGIIWLIKLVVKRALKLCVHKTSNGSQWQCMAT